MKKSCRKIGRTKVQKGEIPMSKKKIFSLTMILILLLSSTVLAFADVQQRETATVNYITDRTSRTNAEVMVDVNFRDTVDEYKIWIYLQKKVDGEWVNDVSNIDYLVYANGKNEFDCTVFYRYTHLKSGEIYRLRCISKDYMGTTTHSFTTYSNQF